MARLSKHHIELTDGKGRCSVPILIAAAPDLLEALRQAPIVSKFSTAEDFITAFEAWRDQYKLPAITNAEGGQS